MSKVARVRGIEIAYDDVGAGAPVVMLHGFPFNRTLWREQGEALAASRRVIMPDLRGHGATTVTDGTATMEMMAEDVAALLDKLNIESVVLGGLSMGGYVALAFYRLFPERVRALILSDTRPQSDTDDARSTRDKTARQALQEGMRVIEEAMLPKLLAPATHAERPDIVARVREMILRTKPEGAAAALRGMAERRDQTDLLPEIKAPTLILVGSEDAITPPRDSKLMREKISGSRLKIIRGAGHLSNIERHEEFNRALTQFLTGLPS